MFIDSNDKKITIKDFTFGDGTPRICVPLMGTSGEEIFTVAKALRESIHELDEKFKDHPEVKTAVIEWRADYYTNILQSDSVFNILCNLRKLFEDRILLFTFRSEEQGGMIRNDRAHLRMGDIMRNVISSGMVDMVDVEFVVGNYNVARATTAAHDHGIAVVMSYHDFEKTPHDSEIEEKLRQMEVLGGDILKFAAMPKNDFDVRRLMELNQKMVVERAKPVALISMGELGSRSRYMCKETGACLTFTSVGKESAPGQLKASDLMRRLVK